MKARYAKPVTVRLSPENQRRFDYAMGLGLAQSEVINGVLADHLKEWLERTIERRARAFNAALQRPVP